MIQLRKYRIIFSAKIQEKVRKWECMKKGKQGFASMNAEKQKAIASRGGKAAQKNGKAHRFNSEEARKAGKIGGRSRKKI